jgi:hypothetical protein
MSRFGMAAIVIGSVATVPPKYASSAAWSWRFSSLTSSATFGSVNVRLRLSCRRFVIRFDGF